jgi:ABC-type transporter Mla maintaining outer membrane lipid asymmetry ATPase subunit MlaF
MTANETHIEVAGVTLAYVDFVIQHDLTFRIRRGDVFIIMGGSGCGKSTVMRSLTGLLAPKTGQIFYGGTRPLEWPVAGRIDSGAVRGLGTTMVVVTHELASIFTIADDAVFLDPETKTLLTTGNPRALRGHSEIPKVRAFLNRGAS